MIHIISDDNQFGFGDTLETMFMSRRARYVEGVGWDNVPGDDGWDTDMFDHNKAVYLVSISDDGNLQSSVRLIPSTAPHVISSKLGYLSPFLPPASDNTWVIDRFVSDTSCPDAKLQLAAGIIEFALEQAITTFIQFGTKQNLQTHLDELGWKFRDLGMAQYIMLAELEANYDALAASRTLAGIDGSILSDNPPDTRTNATSYEHKETISLIDAIRNFVDNDDPESINVIKGLHAELNRRIKTR